MAETETVQEACGGRLFGAGDLAEYLGERQERLFESLRPARRRESAAVFEARVARLEARHHLAAPRILKGLRVIEQGRLAGGRPQVGCAAVEPGDRERFPSQRAFLEARVRYLEAHLKQVAPRAYAVVEVPFEGEADLFAYRPSGCRLTVPEGRVNGRTLRLRIEHFGRHDRDWQEGLRRDLLDIEKILLQVRKEVEVYNTAVSRAIRATRATGPSCGGRSRRH